MKGFKRVLSLVLALVMFVTTGPVSAFSVGSDTGTMTEEQAESYGDFLYTPLADGTLSVCGYTGQGGAVQLPDAINGVAVTQLAQEAFAGNENVTAVWIPESITYVGNSAFYHCEKLQVIAFAGQVPALGFTVAEGCHSLKKILALKDSGVGNFCILLVNDLGQEGAEGVAIEECEELPALRDAYNACIAMPAAPVADGNIDVGEDDFELDGDLDIGLDEITWELSNGVLTVSGTGPMDDYGYAGAPWYSQRSQITSVVIRDGVTSVGKNAFMNCRQLTSAVIGETVTLIRDSAFYSSGLKSVTLPASLKTVENYAFKSCSSLTDVYYGGTAEQWAQVSIGSQNFTGATVHCKKAESYCIYGHTSHEDISCPEEIVTWQEWTNTKALPSAEGNYYLPEKSEITLSTPTTMKEGVYRIRLDLRGSTLMQGGTGRVLNVSGAADACYTITDTVGDSVIIGGASNTNLTGAVFLVNKGTLRLVGVKVDATDVKITVPGSVARVTTAGILSMEAGRIYGGQDLANAAIYSTGGKVHFENVYMEGGYTSANVAGATVLLGKVQLLPGIQGAYSIRCNATAPIDCTRLTGDSQLVAVSGNYLFAGEAEAKAAMGTVITAATGCEVTVSEEDAAILQVRRPVRVTGITLTPPVKTEYREGEALDTTGLTVTATYSDGTTQTVTDGFTVFGYQAAIPGQQTVTVAFSGQKATFTVTVIPALYVQDIETDNGRDTVGVKNTITVQVSGYRQTDAWQAMEAKLYYLKGDERVLIGTAQCTESTAEGAVFTAGWDISQVEDGEYTVLFSLEESDGTRVEGTGSLTVDHSVPTPIQGVIAVGDLSVIHLNWAISAEADTTVYRIYRRAPEEDAFALVAEIRDRYTRTYTDSAVQKGIVYSYYVTGVNTIGQEGAPSEITEACLATDTELPIVTKLSPAHGSWLSGAVTVRVTAQDNVAVTRTELYTSTDQGATWQPLATGLTAALDTTALADGELRVKAVAYDEIGNESNPLVYVYMVDNTGPEQVTGLSFEAAEVTATLHWKDVADQDIKFYRVEKKDGESYTFVTDVYRTLGVNLYDLTPGAVYTYRVTGYDAQGNRGVSSEDITFTTKRDVTAPVITRLRPAPGYYAQSIPVSVTAEDTHNTTKIILQTSANGKSWQDVYVQDFTGSSKLRTLSYTLELAGYAEGYLFVRGVAVDAAGNRSDESEKAPYVQYMVDRTAPEAPAGVQATGGNGYIEILWKQGFEQDLGRYFVYRAHNEDGEYTLLRGDIAALNCFDRDVQLGKTCYYKVAVKDQAGNLSEFSAPVSAQPMDDTQLPSVASLYPASGALSPAYRTVSILATDNNALDTMLVEYSLDGSAFTRLTGAENINATNKTLSATVSLEGVSHGSTVTLRVTATDKAGNTCQPVTAQYTVDTQAPSVAKALAVFTDESVLISWEGGMEADLNGYRIYRRTPDSQSYRLISQRQVVQSQQNYSTYDYNLPVTAAEFIYRIEAVDRSGNTFSMETGTVQIPAAPAPEITPQQFPPSAVISCDSVQEAGVEYYIDGTGSTDDSAVVAYLFDFGDGTTSTQPKPKHTYAQEGKYTVTLTVTDNQGNQGMARKQITVKSRAVLGTAKIRIVDENGTAVSGAPVYFDLGEEAQVIKVTDSAGYVSFTAEVGVHTVGCIIANNQWLPVKKDIIISAAEETVVSMTLVNHRMIEAKFDIKRMTFEEIVAAGIDVSAPENQYIVNVTMHLTYASDKVEISFPYNPVTGDICGEPPVFDLPDGGGRRQVVPAPIWPTPKPRPDDNDDDDDGSGSGSGSGFGDYVFSAETPVAFLDVPVGVSTLKEFFDVNLHIINNAGSEFSMLDNVIRLNIPNGLTLMDTYNSESSATVSIAEIKGQTTETIRWILRGDKTGLYFLSADYSGILKEFNEPISTSFLCTEPIQVYGLSNMKLILEIPNELDHGTLYYNVALQNEGRVDVYRPDLSTPDILLETQLYSATGANISDKVLVDAGQANEFGLAESITGTLDILEPGQRLVKHYACYDQTLYTEAQQRLHEYAYSMQNSYGLEVEFKVFPLDYFKSALSASVNAVEKANQTLDPNGNLGLLGQLLTDENYVYWNMYYSTIPGAENDSVHLNGWETLWDSLKAITGEGSLKDLFTEDQERAEAILLEAMEINLESNDYTKYFNICNWTETVKDWLTGKGVPEWQGVIAEGVLDWLGEKAGDYTEEQLSEMVDKLGKSLTKTMDKATSKDRWELNKAAHSSDIGALDKTINEKWKEVVKEDCPELSGVLETKDKKSLFSKIVSKEGFSEVWESIGIGMELLGGVVEACKKTEKAYQLFLVAQSNLDSCNLFLNQVKSYTGRFLIGGERVVYNAADRIQKTITEIDVQGTLAAKILDETFWFGVDQAKDAALDKLALNAHPFILILKKALEISIFVGDTVLKMEERYTIADYIRFIAITGEAIQSGVYKTRNAYASNQSEQSAKNYMQMISFLLNLRAMGESQAAQFGMVLELIPYVSDSRELFEGVKLFCGMEKDSSIKSWILWRDAVEDKLTDLRIRLLKNPVAKDVTGSTRPAVTFDYSKNQTVQSFDSSYEYSIDGGRTWITCSGGPIILDLKTYSVELLVRRVSVEGTEEKLTGSVFISAAASLENSGIVVRKTETGYLVENLDNRRDYAITFSKEPVQFRYDDPLDMVIPEGSYTFRYDTTEDYPYVYIRALADPQNRASYVFAPPVHRPETLVITPPVNLEYWPGESLDTDGMTVTVVYTDGSEELLTEGFVLTGYDPGTLGEQTVTVTYQGISASFTVTVSPITLKEINVIAPHKTEYRQGEELDLTGMIVLAVNSDNSAVSVFEGVTLTGYNAHVPGVQTITVHYGEATATFTVTVKEGILTGIQVIAPARTVYLEGEELDLTGMTVLADYSGKTAVLTEGYEITGFDSNTLGQKTVTVSYRGFTASFTVTVRKPVILGDVDGDAEVTVRDRALLTRYLANWEEAQNIDLLAADVNQDGSVDTRDRAILTRHLAGWEDYKELPWGTSK